MKKMNYTSPEMSFISVDTVDVMTGSGGISVDDILGVITLGDRGIGKTDSGMNDGFTGW